MLISRCCSDLVSFFRCLPYRCYLVRTSRGVFSPDTQTPVTSHFRVYSHNVPTSILLYRSTSLRTAISSQYYEPYDIISIQSLNLSSNHGSTNNDIFVFLASGDRLSAIRSPPTKSQYTRGAHHDLFTYYFVPISHQKHSPCPPPTYQTLGFPMTTSR